MTEYFQYGGQKSSEFDLVMESDLSFSSPEADITFVSVPGLDGELAIDNKSLKNVIRSYPCKIIPSSGVTIEKRAGQISSWLKNDIAWKEFIFSGDPDFIYTAMFYEKYDVNKLIVDYHQVVLNFTIKPYKFLKSGQILQTVSNGQVIKNIGNRVSRPRLIIEGTGDITINIGSAKLILKGVDKGVIVDSLRNTITDLSESRPQWDKAYSLPPKCGIGDQKITYTGSVTKLQIIPRWEDVV